MRLAIQRIVICTFAHLQICTLVFRGSSSVGRATAFQAVGRGFEPRLPLILSLQLGS